MPASMSYIIIFDSGQNVWSHPFANSQLWGPVLATAGGVLFLGGTNDRYFRAFDASNGKILWEFRTGSGVKGCRSLLRSTVSNTSPFSRGGVWMRPACRRG